MATSQGGVPVSGSSGANPALMSWTERLAYNSAHADFCETNYEHSAYIVEWWNTWTSLMFALLGVAGLLMSSRLKLPARFMVLYILLAVRASLSHGRSIGIPSYTGSSVRRLAVWDRRTSMQPCRSWANLATRSR